MTETKHVFDWHAEPEGFLKWALVHFSSDRRKGNELFERMSEATDRFKNVELRILVSGVEVDAKEFMRRIDETMDWAVEREAKKLIARGVPELERLQEALADVDRAIKDRLIAAAEAAGLEFSEDEWRDLR